MAIQEIIRMGHPTLRQVAAPYSVDDIGSPAFVDLVQDMRETLQASGGIGLAAPQINISQQLVVIEILDPNTRYGEIPTLPFTVFVNPTIRVIDDTPAGYWEGCLSVPGMMGYVERPQHIVIDYLDNNAIGQSLEAKDFLATVFQHEFDHLKGILYVDHLKDMRLFSFDNEYRDYHLMREEPSAI